MHCGFQQNWLAPQLRNTPDHGADDDNDNVCHNNIVINISPSIHLFSIVQRELSAMKSHKLSKPEKNQSKRTKIVCYRMRKPDPEWSAIGQGAPWKWYSDRDELPISEFLI